MQNSQLDLARRQNTIEYFFYFIGILAIIFGYARLYFGVDFLDEAWYVATSQQFALGAKPFINEFSFQQFPFILVAPLFRALYGSPDTLYSGSVIFLRHVYFIVVCIAAGSSYFLLRTYTSKSIGFALASIFFIDVFVIPSVSYNTMGRWMFVTALVLITNVYSNTYKHGWIPKSAVAGLCLVVCVLSYPPMLFPTLAFFIMVAACVLKYKNGIHPLLLLISVFVFLLFAFLIFYLYPLRSQIITDFKMIRVLGVQTTNLEQKWIVIVSIFKLMIAPFLLLAVYKLLENNISENIRYICLLMFILFIFALSLDHWKSPNFQYFKFITYISFIGVTAYPLFRRELSSRFAMLYFFVVIPLALAGAVTALTSANGYTNLSVGISPAAIFALLFISEKFRVQQASIAYFVIIFGSAFLIYVYLLSSNVYREPFISKLTVSVREGPYKGLMTTPDKAAFAHDLYVELNKSEIRQKNTMLCYYNFPACYLFTPLQTNAYSTWILNWWFTKESFDDFLLLVKGNQKEYFLAKENLADVVVRYRPNDQNYAGTTIGDPSTLGYDPMTKALKKSCYHLVNRTELYEIWTKYDCAGS